MTLSLVYGAYWALLSLIFFATGAALKHYYERRSTTSRETKDGETKSYTSSHPMALSLPLGMLLGFIVAPAASWHSKGLTIVTQTFLALLIIIVVRRPTADLKADLKKGNVTIRILIDRFLCDQLLQR